MRPATSTELFGEDISFIFFGYVGPCADFYWRHCSAVSLASEFADCNLAVLQQLAAFKRQNFCPGLGVADNLFWVARRLLVFLEKTLIVVSRHRRAGIAPDSARSFIAIG